MSVKFSEGDVVEVKLSGGIRVPGTIISKNKGSQYTVKYKDGGTHEIHERSIFPTEKVVISPLGERRARRASPGRQTSPPRQKSPSRPKSPGRPRSPGRTKSPARPKSPSRKSPSRKPKQSPSPTREKSTRKNSPSRVLKLSVEKISLDDKSIAERISELSFPRRRKAVEHDSSSPIREINGSGDSNSIKSPDLSLNSSKVLHLKADYEKSVVEPEEKSLKYDGKVKTEFGGWPGALISMIIFPVGIFALNHMCNKTTCDFKHFPKISLKPETYFNQNVALLVFGYITLMSLLSVIPFVGFKVSSPHVTRNAKRYYKMNGLFSLFITIVAVAVLEMYKIPVLQMLRGRYLQLCVTSMSVGAVMSVAMYIHAHYRPISELNTHAVTGNIIYDFFMGRTTNPRILGIDVKLTTLRASLIAVIVINASFVIKGVQNALIFATTETHKPTYLDISQYWTAELSFLLTAALFISLYSLDHLIFESHILTTFEFMYEGFGNMICMGYCAFPFMTTMITKFAFEHGVKWNIWQLVAVWMVYVPALVMYRLINSQKNAYRSNPYSPSVSHLESIPTSQGKKLLVSGYWGLVRHPNYLADLILHACLYSLTPCNPPMITVLMSIFYILYRIRRDGIRCQAKYGVAWDRYCHRVRHNLIPRVF